jgi:hypothetical protein
MKIPHLGVQHDEYIKKLGSKDKFIVSSGTVITGIRGTNSWMGKAKETRNGN